MAAALNQLTGAFVPSVVNGFVGIAATAASMLVCEALVAYPAGGVVGKETALLTVVIVPAVTLVVLAIVPDGKVAARNPDGCV